MNSSDAPDDEWRSIPSLPDYDVSIFGAVMGPRKVLRPYKDADGYLRIGARGTSFLVHRLVAEAFLGPCPMGCEVAHLDHDRANPRLSNLAYVTHDENVKATAAAGRSMRGEDHNKASISEDTARAILAEQHPQGRGMTALARKHGTTLRVVRGLIKGETWKHLPRGSSPPSNQGASNGK